MKKNELTILRMKPFLVICILLLFYPTFLWANILLEDNFDDNIIDTSKWLASGNTAYERNGMLDLQVEVTDGGGAAYTTWVDFDPTKQIVLERDTYNHYANNRFIGRLEFYIEGASSFTFGVNYGNMDYYNSTWVARHGIYLFRNNHSGHHVDTLVDHSTTIPPIWDQWFHEKIIYDPATGILNYYVNDQLELTYDVGLIPVLSSYKLRILNSPWGWWTGHYTYSDDFSITQQAAENITLSSTAATVGDIVRVSWANFIGNVNVAVYKGSTLWTYAATNVSGTSYIDLNTNGWEARSDYSIKVELRSDPTNYLDSDIFSVSLDSDGDGTPDLNDGCPNDPNKTLAGICGCGVADIDTDLDGTPDCNDGCINDINKTVAGVCGCGVADTDSDGDGTADCNDGCPSDPNKTAPGYGGCGYTDDTVPTGTDVNVTPVPEVDVTFNTISTSCNVAVTQTAASPSLPAGYSVVGSAVYDINSDCAIGTATVCLDYNEGDVSGDESTLVLFHDNGSGWVDITDSVDAVVNEICGLTSSFSPFAVGEEDAGSSGGGTTPTSTKVPVHNGLWLIPSVLTGVYLLRRKKK